MSSPPPLRVHPHPTGPWLLVRGTGRLAVAAVLGRLLRHRDGDRLEAAALRRVLGQATGACGADPVAGEHLTAILLGAGPVRRRRGPWWRCPLLPPRLVARLAAPLVPLVSGPGLVAAAAVGLAGLGWAAPPAPPAGVGAFAGTAGLFLGTALLHELAHAAALLRGGYPPGPVGLGLVLVLPVLWCDVSAVVLLPRRERLRVDLAGPVLQLAAAGVLTLAGRFLPPPAGAAAGAAAAGALAAVAWSMLPFIRSDGFWFLGDLSGLGDLDRAPMPDDSRLAARLLVLYRVLHTGFLLLVGGGLAWRLAAPALREDGPAELPRLAAAGLLAAGVAVLAAWRWRSPGRTDDKAGARGPRSR